MNTDFLYVVIAYECDIGISKNVGFSVDINTAISMAKQYFSDIYYKGEENYGFDSISNNLYHESYKQNEDNVYEINSYLELSRNNKIQYYDISIQVLKFKNKYNHQDILYKGGIDVR